MTEYDARVLTDDRETAVYFEELTSLNKSYKSAANWILGPVKSYCNEKQIELADFPVKPAKLTGLIALVEEGKLSFSAAANRLLPQFAADPSGTALALAESMNLIQDADSGSINNWVEQVLAKMPEKVAEYKKGKKGLLGLFVGEVKKLSKGKADPKLTNDLLLEKLSQ